MNQQKEKEQSKQRIFFLLLESGSDLLNNKHLNVSPYLPKFL